MIHTDKIKNVWSAAWLVCWWVFVCLFIFGAAGPGEGSAGGGGGEDVDGSTRLCGRMLIGWLGV